jgi:hypothetical protein
VSQLPGDLDRVSYDKVDEAGKVNAPELQLITVICLSSGRTSDEWTSQVLGETPERTQTASLGPEAVTTCEDGKDINGKNIESEKGMRTSFNAGSTVRVVIRALA